MMKKLWCLSVLRTAEMTSNSTAWVQERRLRPIYELLDGGNNKKVIAEVDRLLKKQPGFTCAKVLKALALIRMTKIDEAKQLLAPVAAEIPTDDGTIQALSICYRELEEPETLSTILEAACEKEKSEELLTHSFMAQVRVRNYKKMHATALQLYKMYTKPSYFGWVVASLVLKYENSTGPLNQTDTLSLELAGRMMEKFASEQKIPLEDNMLDLYACVLYKMANWQKLVNVLKASGYPNTIWRNDDFHIYYTLALERLELFDELFDYLKSLYSKNKDEYSLLKQIIDTFGDRDFEKVDRFMLDLLRNSPNRAVALADLYFTFVFIEGEGGKLRLGNDLKLAIRFTIDKPSFSSDLLEYLKAVSREVQFDVIKAAAPVLDNGPNFNTISKIIKDVNFEIAFKDCIGDSDDELCRIRQANLCFGKYLVCDELMASLRTEDNLRTKESDYHDQYVVLSAINLLTEFYKSPRLQNGCDLETCLSSIPWTAIDSEKGSTELRALKEKLMNDRAKENSTVDGLSNDFVKLILTESYSEAHFRDREALVIFAICVLEYGLTKSPYNYSIRILLSKAYARFGAVAQAIKIIQGLDLKHVQWDTLGYLIFPQALTGGTYVEAAKMLTSAEGMYTSYKRESMEHIIAAYKYGSFGKIPEFLSFRKELLESTQCGIVFTEKRLLELMLASASASPQDLLKYAESVQFDTLNDWLLQSTSSDNRDFSVLQLFDDSINVTYLRELTADHEYYMMKLRLMLLIILLKLITVPKEDHPRELAFLNGLVQEFQRQGLIWTDIYERKFTNVCIPDSPQFHAIFPPRAARYTQILAPEYMRTQTYLAMQIILDHEKPGLCQMQTQIEESCDAMLKILRDNHTALVEDKRIINIEKYIQDFHLVLETFAFSRIVLDVSVSVIKAFYESWKSRGKQKERTNQYHRIKKIISSTIASILEKYKELNECFVLFISTLKERPLPRLDQMKTSMQDLVNDSFLNIAFQNHFDNAQKIIRDSHLSQLEEMRKISAGLVDYIRNNMDPR